MDVMKFILWGCLGILGTLPCRSQTLQQPQRVLTTSNGLPQSYISGLIQDSSGFVWVGTRSGLARYEGELAKINGFIAAGGNLLIAAEPDRQGLLDPVVRDLGVTFNEGRLTQKSEDFAPDFVLSGFSPAAGKVSKDFGALRDVVAMPGVTGVQYGSGGSSVLVDGSIPVAIALTRKAGSKEQRIMVVGDADFMSTAEMDRHSPRTANFDFTTALFSWLNYDVFPVNTSRPKTLDAIDINRDGISLARVLFFCILPLLFLTFGAVLLVVRKRR